MTPIEDLLRQALQDAPAPPPSADPLRVIEARVRRARTAAVAVIATAVVVAAAVVVPLLTLGRGDHVVEPIVTPRPKPSAAPQVLPVRDVIGVTTTVDGSIWSLQRSRSLDRATVVHQVASGAVVRRIRVPGPVRALASGAGAVWAYGGGDGGSPDGVLDRIASNGAVATVRFTGSGPYDVAFVDGTPFVTLASAHRVVSIGEGHAGGLAVSGSLQLPGQVTDIVATDEGQVWVREDLAHRVVHVTRDAHGRLRAGRSFTWRGGLIGAGPHGGIWTADSSNRLIGLSPRLAAQGEMSLAEGYRIGLPAAIVDLAGTGTGGAFVATARGVDYFADVETAAQSDPVRPTAVLARRGVVALAAAPTGGVVAVTGSGRELQWDPGGS